MQGRRNSVGRALAAVCALAASAALAASGQTPVQAPLRITVAVQPTVVLPAARVRIAGTCYSDGSHRTIRLDIVPPGGQAVHLTAHLDPTSHFDADFTQTAALGNYQVVATAPDDKGQARASFTVASAVTIAGATASAAEAVLATASSLADRASSGLNALPFSPPRQKSLARLAQLQKRIAQTAGQVPGLRRNLQKVAASTHGYPQVEAAFRPLWSGLAGWQSDTDAELAELQAQLKAPTAGSKLCTQAYTVAEFVNSASLALSILARPKTIVKNFVEGAANTQAAAAITSNPRANAAWQAGLSMLETLRDDNFGASDAAALATTVASYMLNADFNAYCAKFTGPIEASIHVEFTDEPRWNYDIALSAHLVLMYPRRAARLAHLSGFIEGNATAIHLHEDLIDIMKPGLRGSVVFRGVILPRTVNLASTRQALAAVGADLGVFAAAAPGSFRIPVEGTLVNDAMTLQIEPAQLDFSPLYAPLVLYVCVTAALPVPFLVITRMPIVNAHFILTRSLGVTSKWQVLDDGPTLMIDRHVSQKGTAAGFWMSWKTHVEACNPSCPSLPAQAGRG